MKEVTKWETSDGSFFDTKQQAGHYESSQRLSKVLKSCIDTDILDMDMEEIAVTILNKRGAFLAIFKEHDAQ